jgi:hypothetical protein
MGEDWTHTVSLVPLLKKAALGGRHRRGPSWSSGTLCPTRLVDGRPGDPIALYADLTRSRQVPGWVDQRGLDQVSCRRGPGNRRTSTGAIVGCPAGWMSNRRRRAVAIRLSVDIERCSHSER